MVVVTDHALVRFMERVYGIDMEIIRRGIARDVETIAASGVKSAPYGGVWLVFEGEKLVTVTPTRPTPSANGRHDRGGKNGTEVRDGPVPWQAKKRYRGHV